MVRVSERVELVRVMGCIETITCAWDRNQVLIHRDAMNRTLRKAGVMGLDYDYEKSGNLEAGLCQ